MEFGITWPQLMSKTRPGVRTCGRDHAACLNLFEFLRRCGSIEVLNWDIDTR